MATDYDIAGLVASLEADLAEWMASEGAERDAGFSLPPRDLRRLLDAAAERDKLAEFGRVLPCGHRAASLLVDVETGATVCDVCAAYAERDALSARLAEALSIIRDVLWMAQRYADRRESYAVGLYNDAARKAMKLGFVQPESDRVMWAVDRSGRPEAASLTEAEDCAAREYRDGPSAASRAVEARRAALIEACRVFGDYIRERNKCGQLTCAIGVSKYDCDCWREGERFSKMLDERAAAHAIAEGNAPTASEAPAPSLPAG